MASRSKKSERVGRGVHPSTGDEPIADDDEWIEYGGELIWPMGYTSGGAPYGLTIEEFRRYNEGYAPSPGWARAKHVLKDVVELWAGPPAIAKVGWVRKIGDGLSREIFAAEVELMLPDATRIADYAVALPFDGADPDLPARTRKELRILGRLEHEQLPFRVPAAIGMLPEPEGLALVREAMSGFKLDTRAGRQSFVRPWDVIGEIAAAVHALSVTSYSDFVPGHKTRRQHAEERLSVFDDLDGHEVEEARAWCEEHLPPDEPSVLLHGDLLGQNILLELDEPPAVIDWEYAQLGDPAYDLAIVTRGVSRPFQIDNGMNKLLDAYDRHSGAAITQQHVHVHELCLAAGWYRNALTGLTRQRPEDALAAIVRILRRAKDGS